MSKIGNTFSSEGQVGEVFFKYRDYTPLPLIFLLFFSAEPSVFSATMASFFIFFGEFLRVYSVSFIGEKSRTRGNNTGDKLIQDGPYAFSRNPLYLANFSICFGFALFSGQTWFVLVSSAVFYLQYYYIIQFEEEVLKEKFSSSYNEYCRRVPKLFPTFFPSLSELKMSEDFFLSLKTEKRTLCTIFSLWFLLILFI